MRPHFTGIRVNEYCFCRDANGYIGMAVSYAKGILTVRFPNGTRYLKPADLTFI